VGPTKKQAPCSTATGEAPGTQAKGRGAGVQLSTLYKWAFPSHLPEAPWGEEPGQAASAPPTGLRVPPPHSGHFWVCSQLPPHSAALPCRPEGLLQTDCASGPLATTSTQGSDGRD
jgi:hypothetical protein